MGDDDSQDVDKAFQVEQRSYQGQMLHFASLKCTEILSIVFQQREIFTLHKSFFYSKINCAPACS